MTSTERYAPGWPGIPARWTSSAKSGVGTARSETSNVWFTLSHGIFNEIYYPRIDQACVRDMGLIVTDSTGYLSEEKRDANHETRWLADGVPAFHLVNSCPHGRYRIEKTVLSDPRRDAVLQQTRFIPSASDDGELHLHVLLAPHLGNHGAGNTAWIGEYKGVPMLFAERGGNALALACSAPWRKRSAGFVGSSDGWQDLAAHGEMTWEYTRAENGNVALMAEIEPPHEGGTFLLALAFGSNAAEAGSRARASLQAGFESARIAYVRGWQAWQSRLRSFDPADPKPHPNSYRCSTAVVRTHEASGFPGGIIASLSIPWGFRKGDNDLGGYHLAWPRDLVESAGGLLAVGAHEEVRRVLGFLQATQESDGHWAQNMWLDGSPYWSGIQMDETALPILLVDLARREGALLDDDLPRFWPMVRQAVSFLVCNGPVSPQDRWEEDPGYSPFTVATEIAALLAAADLAQLLGELQIANYLRETADVWNDSVDQWMYVTGSDWCERFEVEGYYVRVAPVDDEGGLPRFQQCVPVKNTNADSSHAAAEHLASPDALALVRFGLRRPDDQRILDTVKIIDALLKSDTPSGPSWHRYNGDGYGEHDDGSPFDGTGTGRAWPLLSGERAHFELAAGKVEEARKLQRALENFASEAGLMPEQIWDAPDQPERELLCGKATGSAMPLVWTHAEYLKLLRSLADGKVFDTPPQTVERYLEHKTVSPRRVWCFNQKIRSLPPGKSLRIETQAEAIVHWSTNEWQSSQDARSTDTDVGVHVTELATTSLTGGEQIRFTFYWPEAERWEGTNFVVVVDPSMSD